MDRAAIKATIADEIRRGGYPFPESLIHAVVTVESDWDPSSVNKSSGASGLMQVMQVVIDDFNKAHKTRLKMADVRSTSAESIRTQIRVGLWALGVFWRGAYKYLKPRIGTVPVDELVKIADLFYVAGPGAARSKLNKIDPPTSAEVEKRYPAWTALNHVRKVWGLTDKESPTWDLDAIDRWVTKGKVPTIAGFGSGLGGFVLAAIVVMLGTHFFNRQMGLKKDV